MPLQPIAPTETALANQVAQRIIQDALNTAKRINEIRTNGLPAVAAQPETPMPNGQTRPAQPAIPAVSAEAINAALGEDNCAILDALKAALGL